MLLVEYSVLDKVQIIREGTGPVKKIKIKGRFQKCDEENNNKRTYPRKVLEGQVKEIQNKIRERSLVGALDHPTNDAIHLSQASHLITDLKVTRSGDVIGEAEILSTPNGKIVEALLNDGVKIGISSRGLGSVSEGESGSTVNEDFKLITFDLVSDPSTKGAFPELSESLTENSQKAQAILTRCKEEELAAKKEKVFITLLEEQINEACDKKKKKKSKKVGFNYTDYGDGSVVEAGSMGFGKKQQPSKPRARNSQARTNDLEAKSAIKRAAAKDKTFQKGGVAQTGKQQDLPFKEGKKHVFSRMQRLIREKNK